jgi:A/G-specific adenine glycosylase
MPTTLSLLARNFEEKLLSWYAHHQRDLPWRHNKDPYAIWISEIMLQQTTVATVIPYFEQWMARWPTLETLAQAAEQDILQQWQGLGYYSRARNLLNAAQTMRIMGGVPADLQQLHTLPGIGPYTAAAIAAIAFDIPVIPVDGNIARVFSRYGAFDDPLPLLKAKLTALFRPPLPLKHPSNLTQALMDLGAILCRPQKPLCNQCPLQGNCRAYQANAVDKFPLKVQRQPLPQRYATAFVIRNTHGAVFLRQRPATGLLAKMMEVPSTSWTAEPLPPEMAINACPFSLQEMRHQGSIVHVFTHFRLFVEVYEGQILQETPEGIWATRLEDFALPTLMKKILSLSRDLTL